MLTGGFSRPDEVADLVVILASDRTANVTGADITIDGGLIPTWEPPDRSYRHLPADQPSQASRKTVYGLAVSSLTALCEQSGWKSAACPDVSGSGSASVATPDRQAYL